MPADKFIVLTLVFEQEGDVWTGLCKELGTAAFGDSIEEAKEVLRDLVELHLNSLEDVGECENFLKERHVKVFSVGSRRKKPADVSIKDSFPLGSFITKDRFQVPAYC